MQAKSVGICLGASTIKVAVITCDAKGVRLEDKIVRNHESNPRAVFTELLRELDIHTFDYGVLTGRKFRTIINARSITEPESIEYALSFMRRDAGRGYDYSAVASLGAENFVVYMLDKEGHISSVETGNKCASGTGEFFLQQISRMDISADEAVTLALNQQGYKVSGRCSVFCKSDCTHALNKGVPIGRVTAGLCSMMAEKVLELLEKVNKRDVVVIGGVTRNRVIMDALRGSIDNLIIPQEAEVFEAVGAAYFALKNKIPWQMDSHSIFKEKKVSFGFLPPIKQGEGLVAFKESREAEARDRDECIIGLDVGSTTTKAVVLRVADNAVLASVYLRTNGNPVKAARECYWELDRKIDKDIVLIGLGATGSGRQIAGLHAKTDSIINEIIAHATGAAHFDGSVDTIFEIGGQDAKYTYLTNNVPSDYAMNEACSAGTGSFLEEAAKESLSIDFRQIGKVALTGLNPPNFNDQCAAFISSDIKTAVQEGIDREDIVAGLVYSICMNYLNRVKGQRQVGEKIFMQGGVCYNQAVPLAMANLLGKEIIVPPNPGLVGAFGVALEVKERIERGVTHKKEFNLKELARREILHEKSFICPGTKDGCDRGCEIATMVIDGRKYPFGGACNKYYNLVHHLGDDCGRNDLIKVWQELAFKKCGSAPALNDKKPTVGINRSFLNNLFFPMFSRFFTELGFGLITPDRVDPEGVKKKRTSLCFPGEIAHGSFSDLLKKNPDYIFLPKIVELHVEKNLKPRREHQCTCQLLQSEAYCLKSAFKSVKHSSKIISPVIDFSRGLDKQRNVFVGVARKLGARRKTAVLAYRHAVKKQQDFAKELKEHGRRILLELKNNPQQNAIVLFGRPYNAFVKEANLGIPGKFSSRGRIVIPWDALPFEDEPQDREMNWAIGQNLLKCAHFVSAHPQLFGCFITNFSCGPDSFLVGYFREIMGKKPSLTLELDSHTADAGVNTRIDAFIDIISKYRKAGRRDDPGPRFHPAKIEFKKKRAVFVSSDNRRFGIHDPNVHLLIPSMGRFGSEILSAVFSCAGIKTSTLPVYDFEALKLGRGNTSCKECLPLILVTGGLLKYLKYRKDPDEYLAYFMPTCGGNCRFSQYNVFLKKLIKRNRIKDVAIFTLTSENGYAGLKMQDVLSSLKAVIISDIMEDIYNALYVLAKDRKEALVIFEKEWIKIKGLFTYKRGRGAFKLLEEISGRLSKVPLKFSLKEAKIISLHGEIFVRRDSFSCQDLIERLARRDIVVKKAHGFEWLSYCDFGVKHGIFEPQFSLKQRAEFRIKLLMQRSIEKKIKKILSKSGLYDYELVDIKSILDYGKSFFDLRFTGESILVTGSFFRDILHTTHGLISIGPFACMPTRVTEAVLSAESTMETKKRLDKSLKRRSHAHSLDILNLPFLSIESDGNPFPQILEARIETFCLQVERLYKKLKS